MKVGTRHLFSHLCLQPSKKWEIRFHEKIRRFVDLGFVKIRDELVNSAQTVVKVALLDTNDHDPKISFKVLPDQSQTFASVNELAKVGTSVAAITVTDADKGKF